MNPPNRKARLDVYRTAEPMTEIVAIYDRPYSEYWYHNAGRLELRDCDTCCQVCGVEGKYSWFSPTEIGWVCGDCKDQ